MTEESGITYYEPLALGEGPRLTEKSYDDNMIDHELVRRLDMATTTISPKFQIVIPKDVREKLHLSPQQRLQVVEKGGVITLVPEVPLKNLKGALKGMSKAAIREKQDRL
ncbi:AbrB/MazE/SpoVT family DNA-binding domain-containing protein [Nitrospira sp. MA-1]|nr:AbrB/MazE/SpoVT family DNA-binding domain-containing protein [Nitrospira sp. MA-1]